MSDNRTDITIHLIVDENGDFVVSSCDSEVLELYDQEIGDAEAMRHRLTLNLDVPKPRPIEASMRVSGGENKAKIVME